MKYLLQFCRILLISFASEILHEILPLPIPASIYGIIVLFGLLESGLLPLEKVRETGRFLIEIMPVMFIPAAIGIVETFDLSAPSLLNYVITVVVSSVLVMGVSGAVTQLVIRSKAKGGKTHE